MIRLFLGLPGSGKTLTAVKEICTMPHMHFISNIKTKGIKNNNLIKPDDIITKELVGTKKDGTPVYKAVFNKDHWIMLKDQNKSISIILDEIHTIYNSRRSMSKQNVIFSDFMALIRKMMAKKDMTQGIFTMISQLDRRVDVIGAEMVNHVRYHIAFYQKSCQKCNYTFQESNEMPEFRYSCPNCGSNKLHKHSLRVHAYHFSDMQSFQMWKFRGQKTYYDHTIMVDGEMYYNKYDTLQWDNLLTFDAV